MKSKDAGGEFTEECLAHLDAMYGVACRLTRNPTDAEDLVQDTMVKAMRARDQFHARVDYANRNFGTAGIEKGMDSDRGRTYIRYGEPSEIRREVMPTNGLQVDDIAKEIAETEGFEQAVPLKGRGPGGDMRSFEVWTYDLLGNPSAEAAKNVGPRKPMRRIFVFVDEEGYGNYLLRYTND